MSEAVHALRCRLTIEVPACCGFAHTIADASYWAAHRHEHPARRSGLATVCEQCCYAAFLLKVSCICVCPHAHTTVLCMRQQTCIPQPCADSELADGCAFSLRTMLWRAVRRQARPQPAAPATASGTMTTAPTARSRRWHARRGCGRRRATRRAPWTRPSQSSRRTPATVSTSSYHLVV